MCARRTCRTTSPSWSSARAPATRSRRGPAEPEFTGVEAECRDPGVTDPVRQVGGAGGHRVGDDELLASREPGSFAVFYRRHVEDLVAFFMRRTRNAELAADLTANREVLIEKNVPITREKPRRRSCAR